MVKKEFDLSRKKFWLRDYDLDHLKNQIREHPDKDDCIIMWKDVERLIKELKEKKRQYFDSDGKPLHWVILEEDLDKLSGFSSNRNVEVKDE